MLVLDSREYIIIDYLIDERLWKLQRYTVNGHKISNREYLLVEECKMIDISNQQVKYLNKGGIPVSKHNKAL